MYNVLNIPHKNIKLVDVELSGALLKQNKLMLNLRRSCDRCDKSFIKTGGLYKYKKNCKVMADIPKTKRQIQQIYDKNHPITNQVFVQLEISLCGIFKTLYMDRLDFS